MLKALAILAVALSFVAYAHGEDHPPTSSPAQAANPPGPAPPAASPQMTARESQTYAAGDGKSKDEPKTVRIVLPPKDNYDRWAFCINAALAVVGILGIGIGVCTLLFIKAQVIEMRRQRIAMQRTLRAINRQADLTEDTAKRQLRAYVCMETANLGFPSENWPVASVTFKNFGQTPAYEVQSWVSIKIDSHPPSIPFAIQKPGHPSPKSTLGPGAATQFSAPLARILTDAEMAQLGTAQLTIFVYGRFTYKDTFGQDRFTHWRLIAGGPEGVPMKGRTEKGEILWALCPDVEGNESN